jgi:hypothetical protein
MKEEYNSIISGEPIRSLKQSAYDKLCRIAVTAIDRQHPDAYMSCCHSHTAAILKEHMDDIKDTDRLVFLGSAKDVAHSILVSEKGEILADSEFNQDGIKVELDMDARLYRVEMTPGSNTFTNMNVVHSEPIGAFKEKFLEPIRDSMYANPQPDTGTDIDFKEFL